MKKMNLIDCHWTNRGPEKAIIIKEAILKWSRFEKGFSDRPVADSCSLDPFTWPPPPAPCGDPSQFGIFQWPTVLPFPFPFPFPICINLLIAVTEVRCNVECVWQNKQWDISDLQPSINKVKSIRFRVAALAGRELFSIMHDDSQQNGKL